LNGLSILIIGELDQGRTARSLAYLLAKFERVKMFFVSPPELRMKPDILQYLDHHGVRYEVESDIDRVIGEADVIYQTRIRPDRVRDVRLLRQYAIDSAMLQHMKADALILHPLPRTVELDKSVDQDPRAAYFRQARNSLYVRMALLTMVLE
jgi:aspartate carbamoyltransferase catalytic subunit